MIKYHYKFDVTYVTLTLTMYYTLRTHYIVIKETTIVLGYGNVIFFF